MMLKASLRVDVSWRGFSREGRSRAEKRSKRVDEGLMSGAHKMKVYAILVLLLYLSDLENRSFIPGLSPSSDRPIPPNILPYVNFFNAILLASSWIQVYSQLRLNDTIHTFAGSHRIGAVVNAAYYAVGVLSGVGLFVGSYRTRPAVGWAVALGAIGAGVEAWQAISLGRVREEEGEMHEE